MYSTCVSSWRVPLMKVTPETSGQSPWRRTICSAPRPFWIVTIVALREAALERRGGLVEPRRLGGDDRDVRRRQLGGIVRRVELAL